MSRYFGLIFVCALSSACGNTPFDSLSAAELNSPATAAGNPADATRQDSIAASQCRLDVTAHVNATKAVETYSTFVCEGSPTK